MSALIKSIPANSNKIQLNRLLAALPYDEWEHWAPDLEPVDMSANEVLCEPGVQPAYMFFPTTAVVSLSYTTEDGASSEIAVVGNDGVVGISLFMNGSNTPSQAMVQSAGQGYRLRAQLAKKVINRAGPMLDILLRYSQSMLDQVTKTAVCNRHHSIDQQLCRRLLLSLDRLDTNDLLMTHEMLANALGVRRESVTEAALKLQTAGVIKYSRGHIHVLDRSGLEKRSCECYLAEKRERNNCTKLKLVN
ncbi:MAG: Crp/Fnr family transcriptional regulator [Methylotenera sp.]|nr:Crp/Fnr family transcriptional regulator [Methylotenera sp.]